jgi:PAS domain S-box-containing protein
VIYLQFWSSYWKNLVELSAGEELPPIASRTPKSKAKSCHGVTLSADEKYGYLTEYGTQMLALFDEQGCCTYMSRNFERLTGFSREAVAGDEFYAQVHFDARERLRELIRLQQSNATPQIYRARMQHADGKNQWYVFMLHPKKDSAQQEVVCVMENIHENILTQNTLQKARMEAELALRSRSEFLANMSHDLRTPLNAVIGFAQMMTSEMFGKIDNPHYLEYSRHIQESGYDLLSKIEDLLEIASLDAGRVTLDKNIIKLGDIMKHVIDAQAHHAQAKQVKLVCNTNNNQLDLNVDRLKIQHILGHLISNALKNCKPGCQINIRSSRTNDGGLRLRVSDNGCGMDDEKLESIVRALREESCWTSKIGCDIGLGLALTKEFTELHGGFITINSETGSGTTIDIMLPAQCVAGAEANQKIRFIRQLVS